MFESNPIHILGYVKDRDKPKDQMSFLAHCQYIIFKSMILKNDTNYRPSHKNQVF